MISLPKKKYQIIYADPPWSYNDPKGNDPKMGGITYPIMTNKEIALLPVNDIADKNCSLFIWITMPKLEEVFPIINIWGFKYITCAFTWVKLNPANGNIYSGLGHWTNGNAELCLFAKKGNPKRIAKNVKQIQMYPRGQHSAKPPRVRNEIVRLMGNLPRIELFARPPKDLLFEDESYKGWDLWGDEV